MELSPGYKQSEAGPVPKDWRVAVVQSFAQITTGARNTQDRIDDGAYPFFVRSQTVERINSYCFDGEAVLTAGDGVGTGKVFHYINGKFDAHQRVYLISDFDQGVIGYFFFLYFSAHFYPRIKKMTAKSSVDSVRREMIAQMPIPFPTNLLEQKAIADALSDTDALIEALNQLIAKKRLIKQGAMQELLTAKRRLPGFSGTWEVKHLSDLFMFSGGVSASRDQLSQQGYCYLHYGDIHTSNRTSVDVGKDFSSIPKLNIVLADVSPSSLLEDGDVVFVDASEDDEGTSKHLIVVNPNGVPFIAGLHTIVAKRKQDVFDNQYLRYCFQTPAIKKQFRFFVVGTKVSGISKSHIGKIVLPLPKQSEQSAIAEVLTSIDSELTNLEDRLGKVRQLKQGMMQQLLTGRIRLLAPKSNVIQFPSPQHKPALQKGHNDAINDAVIISVLAHRYGTDQYPLGRFRYTKLSYFLHRYAEHEAAGFFKKAAGPYKPATKYQGGEKIAVKNGYVREHQSSGGFKGFVASQNIPQAEKYFSDWYGADVLTWLDRFKYKKKDELELLATVDMAMEDVRKAGGEVNVTTVKQVLLSAPEWVPKLDRAVFSDDNIGKAITELRRAFQP